MLAEFRRTDRKKHPMICLSIVVRNFCDSYEGMRSFDELEKFIQKNDSIKTSDPNGKYKLIKSVYTNANGVDFTF